MGCISISVIGFAYDVDFDIVNQNTEVSVNTYNINVLPDVDITNKNSELTLDIDNLNTELTAEIINLNKRVTVAIGLICTINLNTWEYLQVIEGNVILIDGEFIKVLKQ